MREGERNESGMKEGEQDERESERGSVVRGATWEE